MSKIPQTDNTVQPIRFWRAFLWFFVTFVVGILFVSLIEGAIEHGFSTKKWSLESFKPNAGKLAGMSIVAMIWTIFSIIENHNNLLKTQNNFINVIYPNITQDIGRMFFATGEKALKETLIESMISERVRPTPHKIFFHSYVLEQLREWRNFDEELAPAIEVLAKNRLISLRTALANLKNDHASDPSIEGIEQIAMSEAFVKSPAKKILFYDPKTYVDLEKNWSLSFKHFISDTITKTSAEKIQYLIFNDSMGNNPKSDLKLNAYRHKMESAGFKVYVIGKSSLSEVSSNVNYNQRLEIYDDSAVVKIESKPDYSQADTPRHVISLTLSTVNHDANLRTFLLVLTRHAIHIE